MTNAATFAKTPMVYAVATPKGGVGKSTTLSALGIKLADEGKKVLLIDLDNIGSLTNNFQGADVRLSQYSNVTQLFQEPDSGVNIVVNPVRENLHLLQGDSTIGDFNRSNDMTLILKMRDNLQDNLPGYSTYDYVLIDTPAGNGNTVMAALICAHRVYSPIDLDINAIGSLAELTKILKPIRRSLNQNLQWSGFVINRVPKLISYLGKKVPHAVTDREIYNKLVSSFGDAALLGVIALRTPIKTAISSGTWVTGNEDSAIDAANELEQFCKTLLEKK